MTNAQPPVRTRSIQKELLLWLVVPVALLWIIDAFWAYGLGIHFAEAAFDRELVSSADSVAARIKIVDGRVKVDLPPAAQAILRHDNVDTFYYQVLGTDNRLVHGDKILPLPEKPANLRSGNDAPKLRSVKVGGDVLRLAVIPVKDEAWQEQEHFIVQVGETTKSRNQLANQLFVSIILPQILIIVLGILALRFGIARGVTPLREMERAIGDRSPQDLRPVQQEKVPLEVHSVVSAINDLLSRLGLERSKQQRFVSNAAHQLRTPLAVLKAYTTHGLGLEDKEQLKSVVAQIDQGLDRTTRMVNQLLALAKSEHEDGERKLVDLKFLISDIIAELIGRAVVKNIEITFDCPDDQVMIEGDKNLLEQLVVNLIDNALKYTPQGGRILVKLSRPEQQQNADQNSPSPSKLSVELSVSDTGPGIAPEFQKNVFERFFRVPGAQGDGSGLGLSIVQEVARSHKALVSCQSPGDLAASSSITGTTMIVRF
ncbi:MAG: sensor histidine kinase N-terminal domain-containing protein [Candidatus Melainabacteria bacterium]|jgi:two-component system, OmpR family, sensor histidine kinase TctE|nr:sensor histidine kinase N-terminal domain-containing protein [Candidatus Melainabacteria bacterium]